MTRAHLLPDLSCNVPSYNQTNYIFVGKFTFPVPHMNFTIYASNYYSCIDRQKRRDKSRTIHIMHHQNDLNQTYS